MVLHGRVERVLGEHEDVVRQGDHRAVADAGRQAGAGEDRGGEQDRRGLPPPARGPAASPEISPPRLWGAAPTRPPASGEPQAGGRLHVLAGEAAQALDEGHAHRWQDHQAEQDAAGQPRLPPAEPAAETRSARRRRTAPRGPSWPRRGRRTASGGRAGVPQIDRLAPAPRRSPAARSPRGPWRPGSGCRGSRRGRRRSRRLPAPCRLTKLQSSTDTPRQRIEPATSRAAERRRGGRRPPPAARKARSSPLRTATSPRWRAGRRRG